MNRGFEVIGDPFYLHAVYIGNKYKEIRREHVYELQCIFDDKLGYVVTVLETGRSYAYPDKRCVPEKLRRDWRIVNVKE
jgi:hypothetical protein